MGVAYHVAYPHTNPMTNVYIGIYLCFVMHIYADHAQYLGGRGRLTDGAWPASPRPPS